MDTKLNMSQQCALIASTVGHKLHSLRRSNASRLSSYPPLLSIGKAVPGIFCLLWGAPVQTGYEYCPIEADKMIRGLQHKA